MGWLALASPATAAHPVMGKVIAMQSTGWHVIIEFDEDDRHTHATATARVRENRPMTARGDAHRNPSDSNQPLIGEEQTSTVHDPALDVIRTKGLDHHLIGPHL